jgi:murein DD-endopeptidase MepM/ murein hydrolase activator NlpD
MSSKKRDRFYTVLVLSDADSKIRRFHVNSNWLRVSFIIGAIFLIAVSILISNIFIIRNHLDNKIAELDRLKEKISYKEIEVANLESRSEEIKVKTKILEDYLSQVEDLDKMVRNITGKGGYEGEVAIYNTDLNADVDYANDTGEIFYYDFTDAEDLNNINKILDDLIAKAPDISAKLSQDKQHMEDHIYQMDHTPSIWPTSGMITSLFREYRGRGHYHGGLDIANNTGTDVNSSAAGVVIFTGRNAGFGNEIIIHHGFGFMTVYAHLSKIIVSVGDEVTKGQLIGKMGSTGYSTGPHLHYEIFKDNTQVDPMDYLK